MTTKKILGKRILSLALTVLLVLSLVPLSVFSAFAEEVSELAEGLPELSATIDTGTEVALSDADGDGYYDISTADELYAFAQLVNDGNLSLNAELTADIVVNEGTMSAESTDARVWTPIGDSTNSYSGKFEGNSKTVSGLYFKNSEVGNVGLFGCINGGTVNNLGVINSYLEGNYYVGGIVAENINGSISKCYNTSEIIGSSSVGGVVGCISGGSITNCYNAGKAAAINLYAGGVVGICKDGTITNCFNASENVMSHYYSGAVIGCFGSGTVTDCYYLKTPYDIGIGYNTADTADSTEAKTLEQFKSGEVAYLLQGTQEEEIWGQTIGTDEFPSLGGDKVYRVVNCIFETVYSNIDKYGQHNIKNGICTVCNAFEPATDENEDGVYEIGNAGQLYWFADKVNNDNANFGSADAILTADIVVNEGVMTAESTDARAWTPIGNNDYSYTGTFNGNDHTVSGLYFNNSEIYYIGLFGYIGENGEVKNTGVINSYFNGCDYVGGVAGENYYGTITNCYNTGFVSGFYEVGGVVGMNYGTITNCYNTGFVSGAYDVGGVVGYNYKGTITNCYNTGFVSGSSYYVGGVAGDNYYGTITNCYNTGEVSGVYYIGGVAGDSYYGTITNCYYLDTAYTGGIGLNNSPAADDVAGSAEAKTAQQFKSGEVAYLLQGEQTEDIWGQKIGTETAPVLGGDKVYYGYVSCVDDAAVYTNNANATDEKPDHKFDNNNGFCTACDVFEPATDENEDGVYEIANAGQLYWFADKVNNDNANFGSANAILTDNIVVNEGVMSAESTDARPWTPIGNFNNRYTGTFDGNNKTISGLYFNDSEADYIGLISCLGKSSTDKIGEVKNIGVINSYFNGDISVGGVVGMNFGTITNCYNTGVVSGSSYVGGIVGYNTTNGGAINCYNSGNVSGSSVNIGGVAGYNSAGKITNSYNTGTVSGDYVGGVVGYSYSGIIKNCYNTGRVEGSKYVAGVVGYDNYSKIDNCYNTGYVSGDVCVGGVVAYIDKSTITNCYYLDTACNGGIGIKDSADGEDVEGSAEAKTAEQFANGEVAYLLQGEQTEDVWGQKIGTDTAPVLGGDKVYYGYTSCAYDAEMVYTNTEVSDERPAHKEPRAEFDWNTPYDGECYVYMELYCSKCDDYMGSVSGYATIKETVVAEDCLHDGYELYEITLEYDGVTYTDTKSITIKSDNHVGELENGFCSVCGGYEPAKLNYNGSTGDEWDDYYEISNAGQLYWFAEHAINDQYARAVLTDDIIVNEDLNAENLREWISIGESSSMPYCGSFDGQGHTISGLYAKSELNYIGLFGAIGWGASISNLGIKDSYFEGNYYVGGIVGYNDFSNVKNCYAENVEIVAVGSGAALVGYNYGEVSNSYSTSGIIADTDYGTITNCYYLADVETEDGGKTAEQFASGEVAYLLQAGIVGEEIYDDELGDYVQAAPEEIWGQKIGTDAYPVLGGEKVYYVTNCKNENIYSNTNENGQHIYVDGKCTCCGDELPVDKVVGYTISLGDKIAVNYYMSLTEKTLNDANAKMVFTVPDTGSTYTVEIPVKDAVKSGNYYVFTCEVAAKEMTSVIKAKLVTSDSELELEDYSVQKYAEYILKIAQESSSGAGGIVGGGISNTATSEQIAYIKAAPLVKAMLNYGAEAQKYFDYNTDNLANDTEYMTKEEKVTELFDFSGAPYTLEGEEAGVTYYGTALSLEAELMFKHYFIIDESVDANSLEITCDYPVALKKNGGFYELTISDILAHKMGEGSLKVSLGGITLDYTIYSYGALVQNSGNEEIWTVVSALTHFANEATVYALK